MFTINDAINLVKRLFIRVVIIGYYSHIISQPGQITIKELLIINEKLQH